MMPVDRELTLSRRRMFLLAGAGVAAWLPLDATTGDFWNKKPPADWTKEEIDRLITKSPWAKLIKAQYASGAGNSRDAGGYPGGTGTGTGGGYPGGNGGGYPGGGQSGGGGYPGGTGRSRGGIGIPGIGGIGIPGIGGLGRGRGNGGGSPRGGAVSPYEGTVRWESARPVLDAMKSPLPEAFEGRYVISVSGIPLMGGRSTSASEDDDSTVSRRQEQDDLDRLKGLSSLQPKGRDVVQAGVVARQVSSGSSFLFGFSREMLPLDMRDTDFLFTTQLGRLVVKAHFMPKEMLYHGELAV
jgi:hypothetical protein